MSEPHLSESSSLTYQSPAPQNGLRLRLMRALGSAGILVGLGRMIEALVVPLLLGSFAIFAVPRPTPRGLLLLMNGPGLLVSGLLLVIGASRLLIGCNRSIQWMRWNEAVAGAFYLVAPLTTLGFSFSPRFDPYRLSRTSTEMLLHLAYPLMVLIVCRIDDE